MAVKQKIFRIDATLAAGFEAWCQTRGLKQEQAAEAALFHFIEKMPPQEREDLFVSLAEWKAAVGSAPAAGAPASAVDAALRRRDKAKAPPKRQRGQRLA